MNKSRLLAKLRELQVQSEGPYDKEDLPFFVIYSLLDYVNDADIRNAVDEIVM